VENVTNMRAMFAGSTFNQDIGGWNVSSVENMEYMFYSSAFNQDLSNWNVSAIKMNTVDVSFGMTDMFTDSQLSSQNYDKTLIGWAGLPELQGGVELGAGSITFCLGEAARNILTAAPLNWVITDGGLNCSSATDILSFTFEEQTAEAIIDAVNHTVSIEVANTADLTSLPLNLTLSSGATSNPANGDLVDFTNPVSIIVTAEDNTTTQVWTVTVTQEPSLGIADQDKIQFTVYPNPFEELVYIKAAKPFSITLTNMSGAHLRQENSEGELQLNLAGLSPGMYLLVIKNEDGITTQKLIKK
jgi:hypothetical protein